LFGFNGSAFLVGSGLRKRDNMVILPDVGILLGSFIGNPCHLQLLFSKWKGDTESVGESESPDKAPASLGADVYIASFTNHHPPKFNGVSIALQFWGPGDTSHLKPSESLLDGTANRSVQALDRVKFLFQPRVESISLHGHRERMQPFKEAVFLEGAFCLSNVARD
jgi:hypothetical protein